MPVDWQDLAEKHGFDDDRAMLVQLYVTSRIAAKNIGYKLGLSETTVFKRLRELCIETRNKNHNTGPWKRQNRAIFKRR